VAVGLKLGSQAFKVIKISSHYYYYLLFIIIIIYYYYLHVRQI